MKIGRNNLCPCGSGAKFKKCCINLHLDAPDYPTQILGYDHKVNSDPVCMVSNITHLNKSSIELEFKAELPIDSWFISFGAHEDIMLYGPYDSMDECMQLGLKAFPDLTFKFPTEMLLNG